MLFKILFPIVFISAFWLLIKSISKAMKIYGGKKIEFPAGPGFVNLQLSSIGTYKILIKKTSVTGTAPAHIALKLVHSASQTVYPVHYQIQHFESGKDALGNRTIPVATFAISEAGAYQLVIPVEAGLRQSDKLLVMQYAGSEGIVSIISIVFAAVFLVASLVLTILALLNKLS